MEINLVGIAAALATFFGVWVGHVMVRKVEYAMVNLWTPTFIVLSIGAVFGVASFLTSNMALSTMSGIFSMTLCCDAYELFHQQKRVRIGRAPANPNNPRHAKILAEYSQATTMEWLHRDLRGSAYSSAELEAMKVDAK
jgi:hypothetical protein